MARSFSASKTVERAVLLAVDSSADRKPAHRRGTKLAWVGVEFRGIR